MPCGVSIPGGAFLHNIHDSPCAQITFGWKGILLKSGTVSHLRDLQDWRRQLSPKEAFCSVVLAPKDPQVWLHREALVSAPGCQPLSAPQPIHWITGILEKQATCRPRCPQVVQPTTRGALQREETAYTQGYQHEHRNVLPNRCSTTGQQKGEEQRFLSPCCSL